MAFMDLIRAVSGAAEMSLHNLNKSSGKTSDNSTDDFDIRTSGLQTRDLGEAALRAAMEESMDRFEETYRLLATEALSDDPAP